MRADSTWWREARGRLARWGAREVAAVLGFWALLSAVGMFHGWGAWSLLSLPLFAGVVAALAWLTLALLRPVPRFVPGRPHKIRYSSTQRRVTTQATLSLADGAATAAWYVFEEDGDDERVLQRGEAPLDVAAFRAIWRRARATRALKPFAIRNRSGGRSSGRDVVLSFHVEDDGGNAFATFVMPRQDVPGGVADLLARIRATMPAD
ncbi:hypothetical protein [Scleromatobacter humisilvae]|uniref:Uncharacterized protein n=1 Tax=Scleromatobacter humisilvae TaxID=2897159 RepID=A0A9X1YIE2_9BURK|nr:hypothetical protein [Scleromatobacter humisilvae]MCK9686723.1 hypothetical protein [Scleromatobacter humisilvae]